MAVVNKARLRTENTLKEELFSDFFDDLDIHPIKKDLIRYTNEEAVKASIRNLLLTNRGDRLFNPTLGSDIRSMLFENFSVATESVMADLVKTTIENYEPRANILDVKVTSVIDENLLLVTITFSVINKLEPITFELILNRIR